MDPTTAHARFRELLHGALDSSGGLAPTSDGEPELEPSVLAALALGDDRVKTWVADQQQRDGLFVFRAGTVEHVAGTALAAFVLDGTRRERALDAAVAGRALTVSMSERFWGWTIGTYSWVEPTSRVLHALRCLRPNDAAVTEAEALLAERECAGGGWNYGNNSYDGTDLDAYVQTTAVAVMALSGRDSGIAVRGRQFLIDRWRTERGGLSLAQTLLALRLNGLDGSELVDALEAQFDRTEFLGNRSTLAWATFATAPEETIAAFLPAGGR